MKVLNGLVGLVMRQLAAIPVARNSGDIYNSVMTDMFA